METAYFSLEKLGLHMRVNLGVFQLALHLELFLGQSFRTVTNGARQVGNKNFAKTILGFLDLSQPLGEGERLQIVKLFVCLLQYLSQAFQCFLFGLFCLGQIGLGGRRVCLGLLYALSGLGHFTRGNLLHFAEGFTPFFKSVFIEKRISECFPEGFGSFFRRFPKIPSVVSLRFS